MAGLAQYSEYFQNPLFTKAIKEIPVEARYIGSRFLPAEDTYDIDFHETIFERQADMADIVDNGAELPLTDRDPLRKVSGEIADLGQSYIVTKKEIAALKDKSSNDGKRKIAEKQLLGKVATIKKNLDARIEWMRWQALGNGQMVYDKAGIKFGVDFGVEFKKTAAVRWNDVDPDIIKDYETWVQNYVDQNGVVPSTYVTSLKAMRVIMNDPKVRLYVTGSSDQLITLTMLNEFLAGYQLPTIEAFDSTVTYRDPNTGERSQSRLLAENKGIFLREGGEIGVQLMGPTVENDMNPGIYARTFTMERPMREVVEVVAASFPKITNPELVGITTILA